MSEIQKLKLRVDQFPLNELFRFSYAKALIDLKQEEAAIPHLEFCFQKKKDWMVVVMLLGRIALQKDDLVSARDYYQKGLQLARDQKHEGPEAEIQNILEKISV